MKQSSILHRLLVLFSALVLPVIVIGIGLQWYTNFSIRESILSSTSATITDRLEQIDRKFAETYDLAASVLNNSRVDRIANPDDPMSPYERSVNVNFTRDYLTSIKLSNPSVHNIRLYLPLLQIYYNADAVFDYRKNSYLGSQGALTDVTYDKLMGFKDKPDRVHIHDGDLVFLQYSSLAHSHTIVEIIYTPKNLETLFSETLLYDGAYYFFTVGDTGFQLNNCSQMSLASALPTDEKRITRFEYGGTDYYAFRGDLKETAAQYIQVIPEKQMMMSISMSSHYSVIFTIIMLLFSLLFVYGSFVIMKKPIQEFSISFHKIENNQFDTRMETPALKDFQYVYDSFNTMAEKLDYLIQNELKQQLLLQNAQLKQLQAQINPHFLYNSFFMLNQMIAREMNDSAKELSRELGIYFKYITRNYQDEALLADEYQHAWIYTQIQARRFEGRIRIEIEALPETCQNRMVPKLIFQPILENAFQHGLEHKIRGGIVQMKFMSHQESLQIVIEDNGECLTDEILQRLQEDLIKILDNALQEETTGLLNIGKRLQLYYQDKHVMEFSRSHLGGLRVALILPTKGGGHADVSITDRR